MRHTICAAPVRKTAAAPASCARRVGHAATARALVALGGISLCSVTRLTRARRAAVALTTVAVAAQQDLASAARAQEQAGWTVHAHPGQTEVLDGRAPARHTAVAPPSSARCRARYGRQASRRVRPLPCPPSSASIALYRGMPTATPGYTDPVTAGITATATPAPAWPPCRAARQAHTLSRPGQTSRRYSAESAMHRNRHLTVK